MTTAINQSYHGYDEINPRLFAVIPLVLLGSAGIGWLYGYFTYHNTFFYLTYVIYFGLCFGLGLIAVRIIRSAHIRSLPMAWLIGFMIGGGVLYLSHLAYYVEFYKDFLGPSELTVFRFLVEPSLIQEFSELVLSSGYTIGSVEIAGNKLLTVWVFEAIGLIGLPIYLCRRQALTSVYCEACGRWADEDETILSFRYDDEDELKRSFQTMDLSFMERAGILSSEELKESGQHYEIDEEWCTQCNNLHTLSLRTVKRYVTKDEKVAISKRTLFEDLVIDRETHLALRGGVGEADIEPTPSEITFEDLLVRPLAVMGVADGFMKDVQVGVLLDVSNRLTGGDLTDEGIRYIVSEIRAESGSVGDYARTLKDQLTHDDKIMYIAAAIMIANADGELTGEEVTTLCEISEGLGLSKEELSDAMHQMMD